MAWHMVCISLKFIYYNYHTMHDNSNHLPLICDIWAAIPIPDQFLNFHILQMLLRSSSNCFLWFLPNSLYIANSPHRNYLWLTLNFSLPDIFLGICGLSTSSSNYFLPTVTLTFLELRVYTFLKPHSTYDHGKNGASRGVKLTVIYFN